MSWDVILIKTNSNSEKMEEITSENTILFDKAVVLQKLKSHLPELDCSDSEWLVFEEGGDSFEVNLATDEQIMLHINELKDPDVFLAELCALFGCRAFDTTTGAFM